MDELLLMFVVLFISIIRGSSIFILFMLLYDRGEIVVNT